jgi:SAM-dependent methyltransferase
MAQNLGLTNIEFAQADIMNLGSIGRTFDFIDASGVLHHLADPWGGWRVLLSLLRPGGAMEVGLYSERGRRNVVAARAMIAQRGYRPTAEDIRHCREDIATAEDGSLLKSLTQSHDFFAMSECRDLLFHSQEHRLTLPDIKAFLTANHLQFSGFILPLAIARRFKVRFPQPEAMTDLDRWQAYESEFPGTFAGMYLFSLQKPP